MELTLKSIYMNKKNFKVPCPQRWSYREKVHYAIPPETTKKKCETPIFRTLYIRKRRTMVPERQETNGVRPKIAPADCLHIFQTVLQWGGTPVDPGGFPQVEENWESRDVKLARVHMAKHQRGESCKKERTLEICIGLQFSAEYRAAHVHEKITWCRGKKHSEGLEVTVAGNHRRPE